MGQIRRVKPATHVQENGSNVLALRELKSVNTVLDQKWRAR
jgi:hypothetical protein